MTKLWLIDEGHYGERERNYAAMISEPGFTKAMAIFNGRDRGGDVKPYEVRDRVAIIEFRGDVSNRMSFYSYLFGGAMLPLIAAQIKAADEDRDVDAIVVKMDSPGGTPAGLEDFSQVVKDTSKKVVGFGEGMVASACYWAASAMDSVVVSKTAEVGSIGVIAVLSETSEMDKEIGIKRTVIRAGKYKALGNRFEPITKEAKAVIQAEADALYSVFIDAIAENKGLSVDEVLAMAEGKIFIGEQAVDVGLVDQTGTLKDAIAMALNTNTTGESKNMDPKNLGDLRSMFPGLCADLAAEATAAVELPDVGAAVKTEAARIMGLAVVHFGDEKGKSFAAIVDQGVTIEQYTAIQATMGPAAPAADADKDKDVSAEKKALLDKIAELDAGDVGVDNDAAAAGPKDFMAAMAEIKKEKGCDSRTAGSLAAAKYPALYAKHARIAPTKKEA